MKHVLRENIARNYNLSKSIKWQSWLQPDSESYKAKTAEGELGFVNIDIDII